MTSDDTGWVGKIKYVMLMLLRAFVYGRTLAPGVFANRWKCRKRKCRERKKVTSRRFCYVCNLATTHATHFFGNSLGGATIGTAPHGTRPVLNRIEIDMGEGLQARGKFIIWTKQSRWGTNYWFS